ncbi:hypothetical protein F2P56_018427 [Juglans regia]|uniref:Uncharacterized protein n=1 Tax=Juglans regia TaxID=51240 RepID=A0A833TLT5_JUGRE|nr:hypothetical protein F2P56_018427 [Juglans regia]
MSAPWKDPDKAIEYLNVLAEKAHTWTGPSATESTNRSRPAGNPNGGEIFHLREEDNLKAKVEMLTRELDVLKIKDLKPTHMTTLVESFGPCFVCGGVDHLPQECPTFAKMRGMYEEQCNVLGRPFLATANTLINCRNGLMKLSLGNMTLGVNIFHIEKQPIEDDECHQTYMIDTLIDKGVHTTHDFDSLEYFLVNSEFDTMDDSSDVVDVSFILLFHVTIFGA